MALYVQATNDMSPYKGTAPEVRFQGKTNSFLPFNSSFIIDDVALNVCAASPSITPTTATWPAAMASPGTRGRCAAAGRGLGRGHDLRADSDNSSDDGVSFVGPFQAGATATVRVNVQGTPTAGRWLRAWFDWNDDGVFDASERVYDGSANSGDNDLAVAIPPTVTNAAKYRMRLYDSASAPAADALGGASGGEVEDGLTPCVASAPVAEITIGEPASDQVALTWTAPAGAAHYQDSHALERAYFSPGSDCNTPETYACTETANITFTESLADDNPTYVVRAMSTCGSYPARPISVSAGSDSA